MHILFLSDNFPPEVNAPASRTFEHCKEWVKAGHRVTVLTCAPNFPKGKVFAGYANRLYQTEYMEGIRVVRIWSYIAANTGFFRRLLDYISFMLTAIPASFAVKNVDIVVGTSPQFFTVCAAFMVAKIKRVPWIFELRDIWPESVRTVGAMGESSIFYFIEKIELFLYSRASRIVSVTRAFKRALVSRGVPVSKIDVVTNGVDLGRFTVGEKDEALLRTHGLSDKFVAGYIGTHGMSHGLDTVLDAAKLVGRGNNGSGFHFILLGDGAMKAELVQRVESEGIDNVTFIDTVSKDLVVKYWSLLDVAIIHLKKTPLFETVIPSKLFECMAMGIPALHCVKGESADIVARERVGVLVEPEDAQALAESLVRLFGDRDLYQQLSKNGPLSAGKYDRAALAAKMLSILEHVVVKAT